MKRVTFVIGASVAWTITLAATVEAGTPLGTAFTYQGQLEQNGVPVDGSADLSIQLFDQEVGGNQIGATALKTDVAVVNGLFTVELDFGQEAFGTQALWLEVAVRVPHDPDDTASFTLLEPRQPLRPVPMALQTRGLFVDEAGNVGIGTESPSTALTVRGEDTDLSLDMRTGITQEPVAEVKYFLDGAVKATLGWSSTDEHLRLQNAAAGSLEGIAIDPEGNVGIGTDDPSSQLSLGSALSHTKLALFETSATNHYGLGVVPGQMSLHLLNGPGARYAFYDSSDLDNQIFTILGSGNVGIGTTSPTTPLAIRGPTGAAPVGITQNSVGGQYTMELTTADENLNQRTRILLRGNASDEIEFYRGNAGEEVLSAMFDDLGKLRLFKDDGTEIIAMGKLALPTADR